MASEKYNQLRDSIYQQIRQSLERKGNVSLQFAPRETTKNVLHDDNLRRFFRSLTLSSPATSANIPAGITEDIFTQRVKDRKLHDFLAVLIFSACSISAATGFVNQLVAVESLKDGTAALPVSEKELANIFGDGVDVDEFYLHQGCFCTIVLRKREEVRIDSLDNRRLPFLEESQLAEGSFGKVFKVRIARGHFYDGFSGPGFGYNAEAFDVARKDYRISKKFPARGEREIMEKILNSSSRSCENIVENLGSLEIEGRYSLFMPLAICDLRAYMMDHHQTRPNSTAAKAELIRCAEGLAGGLSFLHHEIKTADFEDLMCYHMDLTPSNILIFRKVDRDGAQRDIWKLSDFGMACVKIRHRGQEGERERDFNSWFIRRERTNDPSFSATEHRRGEGTYLAPESVSSTKSMTRKSDVWSLGCVMSVLFAYLEDGSDGVVAYREARLKHDLMKEYDRFFVRGRFRPVKANPAIAKWHTQLVTKAARRDVDEGEAVKGVLTYLEDSVFQTDREGRCEAQNVGATLQKAFRKYSQLAHPQRRPSTAQVGFSLRSRKKMPERPSNIDSWVISSSEPVKGCAVSPDANLVAYWSDDKILLHSSQSLPTKEGFESSPSTTFSPGPLGQTNSFWKSVDLTHEYLVACVTGSNRVRILVATKDFVRANRLTTSSQLYIFDLHAGSSVDVKLSSHLRVQLPVAEILKVAISPNGRDVACVVRRKAAQSQASILHATISAPSPSQPISFNESCWRPVDIEWSASDIIHLTISNSRHIHLAVHPEPTAKTLEHKIPICWISLDHKRIHTLNIESRGFDNSGSRGFYTTFCPLHEGACAVVTRERRLHLLHFDTHDQQYDSQREISNYRILKLMVGARDDRLFALGATSATHRVLLLEILVPRQGKSLKIREIEQIPGLSHDDEFVSMLSDKAGEQYVLVAALGGSNRRSMYRIALPDSEPEDWA